MTLPYWDWSSGPSTGVPAACRTATYVNRSGVTVPNPLYSGPRAAGGQTNRRSNIDTTAFDDLATAAQAAMSATTFNSFQNQMNGVHGSVHVRTGGDMGSVPSAAYDPIFYLHHANIDRLWANWQAAHPGALPGTEASFQLQPFNRPYSANWYTGTDMESTAALGYAYRNFCFYLPPFRLWEVVKFRVRPELAQRIPAMRVVLKSHHAQPEPMEIRVFVNQPDANAKTETLGNRQLAGLGAFFAHGPMEPHGQHGNASKSTEHGEHRPPPQPGVKERFDLELDITRAVREASAKSEEMTLKLVVVDANGNEVPADRALLEQIEVVVE